MKSMELSDEMMEEYTFFVIRTREIMNIGSDEYKCDDPECGWADEAECTLLLPQQVIHAMVYHSDGMNVC